MATFLVERYGPGVSPAAARSLETVLAASGARVIQAIVTEADEVSFWYVEASSSTAVVDAFRSASVPFDRIAAASSLPIGADQATPKRPGIRARRTVRRA